MASGKKNIENYFLMGADFQLGKMNKILERDDNVGFTTVGVYLISLSCLTKT